MSSPKDKNADAIAAFLGVAEKVGKRMFGDSFTLPDKPLNPSPDEASKPQVAQGDEA